MPDELETEARMQSQHEAFWANESFAVVGRSEAEPFPSLTYNALKQTAGKTVYAIDPSCADIEGDPVQVPTGAR